MPPINPFIEFFRDPVFVLGWLAYLLLLVAITLQLVYRLWDDFLWVWNAWEWRNQPNKYGDEWIHWLLPNPTAVNKTTKLLILASLEFFAIAALIYVLTL